MLRRVCVFCGSSPGRDAAYRKAAAALGAALAERGLGLVYGGGNVGLMGVVADAAAAKGGEVIGVIPEDLVAKELAHRGLRDLRVVGSMHERKALMERLSDAFIALPGGFGTLDEFCEILTWAQLGLHAKPCGILDVKGYFDPFLAFVDRAVREGFIRAEHRRVLHVDTVPERLLAALARARPTRAEKWLRRP